MNLIKTLFSVNTYESTKKKTFFQPPQQGMSGQRWKKQQSKGS